MYLLWVVISDRKRKGRDENDFKENVFSLFYSYNGGSWEITPMKEKTWGPVVLRLIDSLESKQNLLWWIIISKQETSNVSIHLSVLLLSIVFDSPSVESIAHFIHSMNESRSHCVSGDEDVKIKWWNMRHKSIKLISTYSQLHFGNVTSI